MEMKVTPPKKKEEEDAGHLLIRWRNATADDLKTIQSKKKIHTNMFPTTTKDAAAAAWSSSPENNKTEEHKPAEPTSSSSDNKDKSMDPPEMVAEAQTGGTKEEPALGEQLHLKLEVVSCRGLLQQHGLTYYAARLKFLQTSQLELVLLWPNLQSLHL